MNKLMLNGMLAMACLAGGVAAADDYGYGDADAWHGSDKKMMKMGGHGMSGKVESVDHKTGWIKVQTDEGVLTVHFPPDSVKDLKEGEMITVHLAYTRGEKKGEMMERDHMDGEMKDPGMTK